MKLILTVDDEAEIRELLTEVLRSTGYRVVGAESVEEAMALVRQEKPDLIITDLQLAESDGFEIADRCRTEVPGVPILLLTGVLFDPAVLQGPAGHGISAYVQKTTSLAHLLKEVQRLCPVK